MTKKSGETAKKAVPGVVGRYPAIRAEYQQAQKEMTRLRDRSYELQTLHRRLTGKFIPEGADE